MSDEEIKLFNLAMQVRENALTPIGNYKVGAAVLGGSGKMYAGCNVESVTFNNSTHAEMNAIDTAIASGEKTIDRLLVVIDSEEPIFPCALCRQKIVELSEDVIITATTTNKDFERAPITELYPKPFTWSKFKK